MTAARREGRTKPKAAEDEKQQFNVFLPRELVKQLKILAIERGDSLSSLVEQIFREQLELSRKEGKWLRN
jgi:hypothetical protein